MGEGVAALTDHFTSTTQFADTYGRMVMPKNVSTLKSKPVLRKNLLCRK